MVAIDELFCGPDDELFQSFYRMGKLKFSVIFEDLTHMEFVTLWTLERNEHMSSGNGVKISDIARLTNACSSAVSRTLNGLERKGYVLRINNRGDRRNTYVEITDEGRKVLFECSGAMDGFLKAVFDRVGEQKMRQFLDILHEIYDVSREELANRSKKSDIAKE